MNSPYRIGLLAAVGALVIGGGVFVVSALGSPPPPQLPAESPVTLQTRSNGDGSFTAPPSDPNADPSTSTVPPAEPGTTTPADPLSTQPPQQVEPPVETYTAPPPPQYDDDDDDDDGDDDDDDDD